MGNMGGGGGDCFLEERVHLLHRIMGKGYVAQVGDSHASAKGNWKRETEPNRGVPLPSISHLDEKVLDGPEGGGRGGGRGRLR
jgi:hypothetical protein